MRKINFQNDNFYHIYNRGVDKRDIFNDERDYIRFLVSMREFNRIKPIESLYRLNYLRKKVIKESKSPIGDLDSSSGENKLVEFVCYSLLSNHYHFILKQVVENGVEKFMHKLGLAYTMYFNFKYNRTGSLFQGTYKSVYVQTDDQLLQLSCYINGNPEIHKIAKSEKYIWSSYQDYLGIRSGTMCNKSIILENFKDTDEYKDLMDYVIKESVERKSEIKNYFLE